MNKSWLVGMLLIGVTSNNCLADDGAKLDEILQELKHLRTRIEVLEKKLEQITPATVEVIHIQDAKPLPSRRILPAYPHPSKEVDDVMRMQFENSGELLEGIHEREQRLRKRLFFPEVFAP